MSFIIAPIVEGHGDVPAIRVLLGKLAPDVAVAQPVRQKRHRLVQRDGLRHAVAIASANIREDGAILVLIDADEDCPAELAAKLAQWMREDFRHLECHVVLAVREFEAWIVGGDPDHEVDDPDGAGDLEGRIKRRHGHYKKSVDQPRLTARIDIARLRDRSRSFRKMAEVAERLIEASARHGDRPRA